MSPFVDAYKAHLIANPSLLSLHVRAILKDDCPDVFTSKVWGLMIELS
jgi:hypothetical protein